MPRLQHGGTQRHASQVRANKHGGKMTTTDKQKNIKSIGRAQITCHASKYRSKSECFSFFSEGGKKVNHPPPTLAPNSRRSRERMVSSHTGHSQASKKNRSSGPISPAVRKGKIPHKPCHRTASGSGVSERSTTSGHTSMEKHVAHRETHVNNNQ